MQLQSFLLRHQRDRIQAYLQLRAEKKRIPVDNLSDLPINAEPTKQFFVDMITRDIQLEQAVLDLIDNSVDGARRSRAEGEKPLDGFEIKIEAGATKFSIWDNCGGFDRSAARDYAFRFGRPDTRPSSPHAIGQFGVGMKRALFKFGRHFTVASATETEKWAVDVNVDAWEVAPGWTFPWSAFPEGADLSEEVPGTAITVDRLRPEVSARFATDYFVSAIRGLIASKHRQFLAEGLLISVNGRYLNVTALNLLTTTKLRAGVDTIRFEYPDKTRVDARLVVGVGESVPREAGWYVVCNGRMILEADRRPVTGWGLVEAEDSKATIPTFHNQFARFRGIVWFDSDDSSRVPWNTTKTDVDQDSSVWQQTFLRMVEMMRPVIDFMNELDRDVDENTKDHSLLLNHLQRATRVNTETIRLQGSLPKSFFVFPKRGELVPPGPPVPPMVKIQYSRPKDEIDVLADAFGLGSAKAVGERTFDMALRQQESE